MAGATTVTTIAASLIEGVIGADTFCDGARVCKLFRTDQGIFGCAGDDTAIARFEDWQLRGGPKPEQIDQTEDFEALQLSHRVLYLWGRAMRQERILAEFHAIGSGGLAAKAVLKHHGTVHEALRIAAYYDGDTKPPFTLAREDDRSK